MAEQMLAAIGDEIQAWPQVKAVSILHRVGRCEIGEPSVVIAVATPHRGDGCFEACSYAIGAAGGSPHLETGKLGGRPSLGGRPAPARTGPDSAGAFGPGIVGHTGSGRMPMVQWARIEGRHCIESGCNAPKI
ncbi:MAG: molybdenum cofactor biosynthesis protein MoaE [Caldilineaceae bacterium]